MEKAVQQINPIPQSRTFEYLPQNTSLMLCFYYNLAVEVKKIDHTLFWSLSLSKSIGCPSHSKQELRN